MPRKGFKHFEESRQKMSEAKLRMPTRYWLGKHHSQATKIKSRNSHLGKYTYSEKRNKNISLAKLGHSVSEETRKKISIGNKGTIRSDTFKERSREFMKERWKDPEYRKSMFFSSKLAWQNPEYRLKVLMDKSANAKKGWQDPERRKKQSVSAKLLWQDPEYLKNHLASTQSQEFIENRRRISLSMWKNPIVRHKIVSGLKRAWSDPIRKEIWIKATLRGLLVRPTSLEKQMIEIINKHNLPYRYTGNGSFLVGFKNPDFVNVNDEKVCIEVANNIRIHHPIDYPEKRTAHFAKWGWKCVVFMKNQLDEQEVIKKLSEMKT